MDLGAASIFLVALIVAIALAAMKKISSILSSIIALAIVVVGLGAYIMLVPNSPLSIMCSESIAKQIVIDVNNELQPGEVLWEFSTAEAKDTQKNIVLDKKVNEIVDKFVSYVISSDDISQYYLQFKDAYLCVEQADTVITAKLVKGELINEHLPITGEGV